MKKVIAIVCVWVLIIAPGYTQSLENQYRDFKHAAQEHYSDFREQANAKYVDFLRSAWKYYNASIAVPHPQDEPIPPVVYDEKKQQNGHEIKGELVPLPKPQPIPQPVAPIIENDGDTKIVYITYYGTQFSFRAPKDKSISLQNLEAQTLAAAWDVLAGEEYNNLMHDCLFARDQYNLCDWAYLSLLQHLSETLYGKSNESVLLQAFIFANSGYKMRLAVTEKGQLHILVGSEYTFYDHAYYEIDGEKFFPLVELKEGIAVCNGAFENEKPLSLFIASEQNFASSPISMPKRKTQSGVITTCSINKNLIDFYNSYPTGHYRDDFGTRWAVYANSPLDESIKQELYPQLKSTIHGAPESQAVNVLLNWVQTAFEYEYDDKVWGSDRAFFPAESLYYPYCDCEDRSILFSRLVRDLLGLDVVLLYYPGHLATAVKIDNFNIGDYVNVGGERFIICDPTYIGAPVGMSMPNLDNSSVKVIMLK
jgi:hypothetical protein